MIFAMKYFVPLILTTALAAISCSEGDAVRQPARQAPLTLHYDSPANVFERTLVIGNGTIGGSIYGGIEKDVISLNDITLWTGEPESGIREDRTSALAPIREALFREDYHAADSLNHFHQGHYSQNYQPLGTMEIEYEGHSEVSDYKRSLDISEATASTSYLVGGHLFNTEYFASAPDSAIVIRLKSDSPDGISAKVILGCQLPHEVFALDGALVSEGYAAYFSYPGYFKMDDESGRILYDPARGIHFRTMLKAIPVDGKAAVGEDGVLSLEGCHDVTLVLVNATSFNGFDKDPVREGRDYRTLASSRLALAAAKDFNTLKDNHIKDYKTYFDRVSLFLGETPESVLAKDTETRLKDYMDRNCFDPALEVLYYQFARYLMISSSRTPGVPPNLQGLWNEMILPPWSSNYTININLEENFWGAKTGNLLEMEQTLLDLVKNMSVDGVRTAGDFYGVNRGWCAGHNTDIWAMTDPVGLGVGDPCWANWNMGGAWLAMDIWENYAFSGDKAALKEYYPVLKGAAEFCLGWMIEKDGELITAPSTSPENRFLYAPGKDFETSYGATSDLAIIRECLMDARDAARVLRTDNDFIERIEAALAKMHPYKIGSKGNLQEWYHDFEDDEPTHRHHSHMIGLYPGHSIDPARDTALARACERSLEIRGDKSSGWSTGWKMNLWARLGNGDRAYSIFRNLLSYKDPKDVDNWLAGGTFPNFLDAHPPFQIDGNFGGSAGVTELLVQSSMDMITLLPALPSQWKDGSLRGVRARGGFVLDFDWKDGKVTSLRISSEHGGKTELVVNGRTYKVRLRPGRSRNIDVQNI